MSGEVLAIYLTLLAFLGGACIGSFLNVCIHRIPREESIVRPRSRCPGCGAPIAWFDNVPVISFFALRGRCRSCGTRISMRYPLVELLTAVLFLALWNRYGLDGRTLVYMAVAGGLIVATFVDFDFMIIPDRISLGGMLAGPLASALVPSLHGEETTGEALVESLIGLVAGSGSLYLVAWFGRLALKKDAMGLGDVKLLGAIGAFIGWQGVLFTVLVSSMLGSVIGLALIFAGGRGWGTRIPYGPYLAAAALIWILGGSAWWDAYVSWMLGN